MGDNVGCQLAGDEAARDDATSYLFDDGQYCYAFELYSLATDAGRLTKERLDSKSDQRILDYGFWIGLELIGSLASRATYTNFIK